MKWKNKGHEFDQLGEMFRDKDIIIYGAGNIGRRVYEEIKFLNAVIAFVDRNEKYQQEGLFGVPVIPVQELAKKEREKFVVIIATERTLGIRIEAQLLRLGFEPNKDMIFYDNFLSNYLPIYALYGKRKLYFPSVSFTLTTVCNLNCKGCLNFTPYNKSQRHFSLDELKRNVDDLFKAVDFVGMLHLSGGEPFLYGHLAEILDYIGENYRERIWKLRYLPMEPLSPMSLR